MRLKYRHSTSKENVKKILKDREIKEGCATPSRARSYAYGTHTVVFYEKVSFISWLDYHIYWIKWLITGNNAHAIFWETIYSEYFLCYPPPKKLERFKVILARKKKYNSFINRLLNR